MFDEFTVILSNINASTHNANFDNICDANADVVICTTRGDCNINNINSC